MEFGQLRIMTEYCVEHDRKFALRRETFPFSRFMYSYRIIERTWLVQSSFWIFQTDTEEANIT